MKLIKVASGKTNLEISRREWKDIGKEAGWMGLPDDVNLNINYGFNKDRPSCPKCQNKDVTLKRDKNGKVRGKCSCGYKWTE